jgi:hypothetical protein
MSARLINGCFESTLAMAAHMLGVVCAQAQRGDYFAAGYNLACVANMNMDEGLEVSARQHELVTALQDAIREFALGGPTAVARAVVADARLWTQETLQ